MESKEEKVLELFFDNPTKEWHFEEILREAKIARSKADGWLKRFAKEGIIQRVKPKGKMPYYMANHESSSYRNRKKLFALNKLYESGLLDHLSSLKAKTVIIFGSITRSDWYKKSDIDIFIYGKHESLTVAKYEAKLHRNIQVFTAENNADLAKMGEGLIKNIITGDLVKGDLDFIKVKVNA